MLQYASSHNHSEPKNLNRARYKVLGCARKMVEYEEKLTCL